MTHAAYYYLVGQAITYLFAKWWLSGLVVAVIYLIDLIITNNRIIDTVYWVDSGNGLFGWLSVFFAVEFMLSIPPIDLFHMANKFSTAVNIITQVFIFTFVFSILLVVFEPEPYLYGIQIFIHAIGIFILSHINLFVKRFERHHRESTRYYFIWALVVIVSDFVFLVLNSDSADVLFWTCLALGIATTPFIFILGKHLIKN